MSLAENQERILYQASPVMFGARPFLFILYLLLCPLLIGFILLLGWHFKRRTVRLIVTEDRISLETGQMSRSTIDIFHENIHSLQTHQTTMQRLFRIGEITVKATNVEAPVITIDNIPYPTKLKKLLEDRHHLAAPTQVEPGLHEDTIQ
jgi:uncharacterized membrane protein YdbT with pleckstrin-like domain